LDSQKSNESKYDSDESCLSDSTVEITLDQKCQQFQEHTSVSGAAKRSPNMVLGASTIPPVQQLKSNEDTVQPHPSWRDGFAQFANATIFHQSSVHTVQDMNIPEELISSATMAPPESPCDWTQLSSKECYPKEE